MGTLHATEPSRLRPAQRPVKRPADFTQRHTGGETDIRRRAPSGCACGGSCPRCQAPEHETGNPLANFRLSRVSLRGEVGEALADDGVADETAFAPEETPTPETPLGSTADCPVTAVFSSMLAGTEKASCQVPQGQFGVARLARFTLRGLPPGGGSVTIQEQFTKIDDPCGLYPALKPNSFTTSQAIFDDCYMIASKEPLPEECTLTVEQNHLLNGKIISKNRITFGPRSLRFCSFPRLPGSCDFSSRCKK
ncbi:hypothetical protein [Pseudomonas sp. BN102]|uniref:hypothetical protein n=1 Tax=Pseudomonas sp. BN102 TaxID=2567886 RepID=UPI00245628B1|nr:hypothetical protein [Pseudomonas sp. BN102]MDH4607157.1 hypothetical protein [Pseudomonas sp. BN102]